MEIGGNCTEFDGDTCTGCGLCQDVVVKEIRDIVEPEYQPFEWSE